LTGVNARFAAPPAPVAPMGVPSTGPATGRSWFRFARKLTPVKRHAHNRSRQLAEE